MDDVRRKSAFVVTNLGLNMVPAALGELVATRPFVPLGMGVNKSDREGVCAGAALLRPECPLL